MKSKSILISVFCLVISAFFGHQALAGSATVSWNANTESDLAGYKIYYGTSPRTGTCPSGGYASSISVNNVTSYTFSNLTDGATYYFSVTAIDTAGLESCFSYPEVSKLITSTTTKPGDITGSTGVPDGVVNARDLGLLLGNWGTPTNSAADITGSTGVPDGVVNARDLGLLLGNWG